MKQSTSKSQSNRSFSGQRSGSGTRAQPSASGQGARTSTPQSPKHAPSASGQGAKAGKHTAGARAPQPNPTSANQHQPPHQPRFHQNQHQPRQFPQSFQPRAFPATMRMGMQAGQPIQITVNIQSTGFPQNYSPEFSGPQRTSDRSHTQKMPAHQQPQSKPGSGKQSSEHKKSSPIDGFSAASGSTSNSRGQSAKGQHTRGQGRGACSSSHSEAGSSARGNMRGNRWNNQRRGFNRSRGGSVGDGHNINVVNREQQQRNLGSSGHLHSRGQRSGWHRPRGGRVSRGQRWFNNESVRTAAPFSGTSTAVTASNSSSNQLNSGCGLGYRFPSSQRYAIGPRRGWVSRGRAGHVIATSVSVDNQSTSDVASTAGNDEWSDEDVASSSGVDVASNILQSPTNVFIPRGYYRGRGRGQGRGHHHFFRGRAARDVVVEKARQEDSSNLNTYVSEWINRNVISTQIEAGSDVDDVDTKSDMLSDKADDTEWVDVTETVVEDSTFESDGHDSKPISIQKSRRPNVLKRGRGRSSRAVRTRRRCEEPDDKVPDDGQFESDREDAENSVENIASTLAVEQVDDFQSKTAVTENKVDENTVIWFLVNNHRGRCQLNQLRNLLGNEMQLGDIEQLLRPFRRIKVFKNVSNLGHSVAFVHLRGLRICGQRPTCRAGDGCSYLHLCPDLIAFPSCRNVSSCQHSHDLFDARNTTVVEKVGILTICKDKSVLLDIVRSSNGVVCAAHNKLLEPTCTPETCLKLHVCNSFLQGRCLLPSSSCNLGHDLYSGQNGTLLDLFELKHMQTMNERFLFRMIYIADIKPGGCSGSDKRERVGSNTKGKMPSGQTNVTSDGGSELDRPEGGASLGARAKEVNIGKLSEALNDSTVSSTLLCKEYEPHHCQSDNSCRQRHSDRPFVWRLMLHNVWLSFEDDIVIERAFCDPSVQSVQTSFKSTPVTVNFKTMSCEMGAVQRLTTPSYVICRNETDATRWCWYWNERKCWNRFADDKPPFQNVMESKYLYDKSAIVCFENSGKSGRDYQQYLVDFGTMQQTNLKTGFIRAICRRPVFHLGNNSAPLSKVNFHYDPERLPLNECWSPMNTVWDGWTDLVPFTEQNQELKHLYSRVSAEFMKSLPSGAVKICKIYRIQNLDLWKKYQEKKAKMSKVADMPQQFERYLFHGTPDEQTVRCICHQNFDPRMHGRHGTVYGKGAYFSTTSKYSHGYTKPVNGSRYMFYARVLVGKYTLGTKDLPRPPAIDSSRPFGLLFDTCVNNVKSPNIFVVFDNEQCYPEFLIEYQELTPPAVEPVSQQTASDALGGAEAERDPTDQGCFLM